MTHTYSTHYNDKTGRWIVSLAGTVVDSFPTEKEARERAAFYNTYSN